MKRVLVVVLLGTLAAGVAPARGEEETNRRTNDGSQTYESPILTLLLLPVNILVKMASTLGPKSAKDEESGADKRERPPR